MKRKLQKFYEVIPKKYHKKLVKLNCDFKNTKTFIVNENAERRIGKIINEDQFIWKLENGLNLLFDTGLIFLQDLVELYYFQYFYKNKNEEKLILIDLTTNVGWIENNFREKGRTEIWYGKMKDYRHFSKNKLFLINHSYSARQFETELSSYNSFRRMMLLLLSKYDFVDTTDGSPLLKTKQKIKKYGTVSVDNIYNIDKCFFSTIEIEATTINGYFRRQRYGVGKTKTKMIFVRSFKKRAYKRKAKKLCLDSKHMKHNF